MRSAPPVKLLSYAGIYARRQQTQHSCWEVITIHTNLAPWLPQIAERAERARVLDDLRNKVRGTRCGPLHEVQRVALGEIEQSTSFGAHVTLQLWRVPLVQIDHLTAILSRRADEARANTDAHRAALIAAALAAALDEGRPMARELQVSRAAAKQPATCQLRVTG